MAVSDQVGQTNFYHFGDAESNLPTSSSLSQAFMETDSQANVLPVRVTTLDEFVANQRIDRVDLVKIDTESTEPAVLRGMKVVLERHRPDIICEVLKNRGSESALEYHLGELGYSFFLLTPNGPVRTDCVQGHPYWLNYWFTPTSEILQTADSKTHNVASSLPAL